MLKHFLNPPNWFTSASMFCGLYAIVLATGVQGEQNFYRAGMMILFAGVFDMLDGRVARLTGRSSDFGLELDSLTDVVSFGIAPAVLLYAWAIHGLGALGLAGAFFFLLCGAFRLARFNVKSLEDGVSGTSQGLTITMAGATVAAAVMSHAASGRTSVEHPLGVLLLATLLALMMVSSIPYMTPKALRLSRPTVAIVALTTASILVIGLQYRWSTAFLSVLVAYAASGPIGLVLFRRGRRVAAARTRLGQVGIEVEDEFVDPFAEDDE